MSITESQRTAARIAGFAFIAGAVVVAFGEFYLAAGLYVPNEATQTAANILAHETRFRLQLACNLFYVADILVLLTALYMIFKPVSQGLALAAVFFRLIFAIMWCMTALNMLGALSLLGDLAYLKAIGPDALQALARVRIHGDFDTYYVGLPFWAIAATLTGWLWLRSGYIPKALALFNLVASAWCVFCACAYLVFPHFSDAVNLWFFDIFMALAELATGLWLLIKGLRPARG